MSPSQPPPRSLPASGRQGPPAAPPGASLRSEVVQDLVSQVPAWPVRAGNTAVFALLVLLLALGWYIRYPDRLEARVTLTTKAPPVRVVAQRDGRLERVFVREKARVAPGAPLALLDNAADYDDMRTLMRWTARADSVLQAVQDVLRLPALPGGLSLGTVQDSYVALQQRLADTRTTAQRVHYVQKREALVRQRSEYEQLGRTLADQQALAFERLALARSQHERMEALHRRQVVASAELERATAAWLQAQSEHKDAERAGADNQIRLAELEGALAALDEERAERGWTQGMALQEAYERLVGQVAVWRKANLLEAPVAGQVTFFSAVREKQYVQASEPVLAVVPEASELFGQVRLPQAGAGLVHVGQRVRITLDSYPAAEYGVVEGVVEDISLVVQDRSYLIRVALPGGLRTSYGVAPAFRQEMEGTAAFVTVKVRLLARLFDPLRYAFDRNANG